MARTILTAVLIVLLNVLVGCNGVDSGRPVSQISSSRWRLIGRHIGRDLNCS
jgi:hypothetical protein